jgi:AcrR family transcriptional regulator
MSAAMSAATKPLRKDAERNLRAIRAAALAVISERGTDAGMEEIAQRAGVGVGTLYRRFPSKEALVDELTAALLDDLLEVARATAVRNDPDGLAEFLRAVGGSLAEYQGCANEMLRRPPRAEQASALRVLIAELTAQAHEHGRIAAHVMVGDVHAAIWALRGVVETSAAVAPRAWERHLELHLAGLRAEEPPGHRRAITHAQLEEISARRVATAASPQQTN